MRSFCPLVVAVLFAATVRLSYAQSPSAAPVYFLAAGPKLSQAQDTPEADVYESFVVPVGDAEQIAAIRALIQQANYPVVNVQIKAGNDGTNRDFYQTAAPAWNWMVTRLVSIQGEPENVISIPHDALAEERYGSVSMIAVDPEAWINKHGDQLAEQWFPLTTEVDPSKTPAPADPTRPIMSNLSVRGATGNGQDILIGGVSISGDRPKQVAIRCSGTYLLQPFGLLTGVSPWVRMFDASGKELTILYNQRQYELAARFRALTYIGYRADTLAIATLYPGQYTFQVYDHLGYTGLVLLELYDLSLAPQPFP